MSNVLLALLIFLFFFFGFAVWLLLFAQLSLPLLHIFAVAAAAAEKCHRVCSLAIVHGMTHSHHRRCSKFFNSFRSCIIWALWMWIVESSSSSSSNVSMWRWRRCFATISAFNVVNVNCLPTIIAIFSTSYTSQFIFSNFFFICKLPECTRYHFLYVWIPHTPSSDKRRRQFSNGIYKCDFFVSYFHLLLVAPFSSVSNECLWLLCSVVIVCDKQFSVCGVTLNTIYWPIKQYYWQYTHTYKLSVSETVSVIIVDFVNQSLLNYGVTTDKQRQNRNDKWMYDNDNDANFGWLYGIDFFSTWTEWRQIWSPKCTYNECCHIARSYISCVYLCAPSDVKYNYWVIAPVITYHCQWPQASFLVHSASVFLYLSVIQSKRKAKIPWTHMRLIRAQGESRLFQFRTRSICCVCAYSHTVTNVPWMTPKFVHAN